MDEQDVQDESSQQTSNKNSPAKDGGEIGSEISGSAAGTGRSDPADEDAGKELQLTPEELPTMQWPDIDYEMAEFERRRLESERKQGGKGSPLHPGDDLEEAMTWLEEMAAGQGIPVDEMPTLVTASTDEDQAAAKNRSVDGVHQDDLGAALELDSDPMAWLEQLAVDQSSPLEELPSVADRLLASEIVSQNEIPPDSSISNPIDIGQAVSYLEQLARTQGVDLSEVRAGPIPDIGSLAEALAVIDAIAARSLAAASNAKQKAPPPESSPVPAPAMRTGKSDDLSRSGWSDLSAEMPDDPQQALRWLSDLGVENRGDAVDVVVEADTIPPAAAGRDTKALPADQGDDENDNVVLDEMPEDPDEAMAWMSDLASKSGTTAAKTAQPTEPKPGTDRSAETAALSDARSAAEAGDLQSANSLFQSLLDEGKADQDLVDALEDVVEDHGETPELLRLLGDAYMQTGQIEKAVTTYRKGFDHL